MKKAGVPSQTFVKMIKDMNIRPAWGDIPLPSGTDGLLLYKRAGPIFDPATVV
jgi:hypothetical protein